MISAVANFSGIFLLIYFFTVEKSNETISQLFHSLHPLLEFFIFISIISTIFFKFLRISKLTWHLLSWLLVYGITLTIYSMKYNELSLIAPERVIEVVILFLAIIFSYNFSKYLIILYEQTERDELKTLSSNKIVSFEKSEASVETEFIRARRYKFPVTLIAIKLIEEENSSGSIIKNIFDRNRNSQKMLKRRVGNLLSSKVRNSDQIIYCSKDNIYLLVCPELARENATIFLERLQTKILGELNCNIRMKFACFPEDGIVYELLYEELKSQLSENPEQKFGDFSKVVHIK